MKLFISLLISICALAGCTLKDISHPAYKKQDSFQLKSFEGKATQLIHKKSGAELFLIQNKDQARTFMASFKTPPYDDTGLFHTFEHAVLAGSRLYPSKSNFHNVSSSSIASFINAMTGPIWTSYLFVTRDSKDFENLLSVYMDAVFFPKAITEPNLLKREGWRYEIAPDTKKMSINGVVFNEVKGVFSGPYQLLWKNLTRAFLPQTPYFYESGGTPEKIPNLQFQQFVSAHKKYYHPQNSLIFLYGDIEFKKTLDLMDKQFLSHFQKSKTFKSPALPRQKDFKNLNPSFLKTSYPAPKGNRKKFMAKVYLLEKLKPLEEQALFVLMNAFAGNDIALLKLRILKEKLAKSVFSMGLGDHNAKAFVFETDGDSKKEQLESILEEEINKIIEQGMDQKFLTSILNKYEFLDKERNHNTDHKGIRLGLATVLDHWLYPDQTLEQMLDKAYQFQQLRKILKDQSFIKKTFQTHFKNNSQTSWFVMEPDPLYSQKFNQRLEANITKALQEKSLQEHEKEYKLYQEWNLKKNRKKL